jgi:hypothetical protein
MFFVDDSNIWIEAQKFAASGNKHMPKLEDSDVDPRLRIDIGNMIATLCKGREQGPSFLYGSRPPPNDSVWNAFENNFRFKTKIYNRNLHNKEKEVDNSMATDLVSQATELHVGAKYDAMIKHKKKKTIFVVITGDRDMLPSIKKVLECDIRVELWGWRKGIAKEYYNDGSGLLSVDHLDSEFHKIFFTNFRSTRRVNKAQQVDPARTIVLCGFDELDGESLDESSIGEELDQLRHLFYIIPSTSKAEILVEFPNVYNIESMISKLRELFKGILTVVSWPEYSQRFNKRVPAVIEKKNMYALLEKHGHHSVYDPGQVECEPVKGKTEPSKNVGLQDGHGANEEARDLHDPDDNEGWQTVTRSDPGKDHRRALRQRQQCPSRVRCRKRGECGYGHSKEERDMFQDNPNQDFSLWKTKRCKKVSCHRGRKCSYAHTPEEGWCLFCKHSGHCTDECRYD